MKSGAFKISGIDSLRFICALWVVFSHLGPFPLHFAHTPDVSISSTLRGLYGSLHNGPAAVIIFFIISGFCIHYPYRKLNQIPVLEFLCRRYLRIGIPLLIATGLACWLDVGALIIQPGSLVISRTKILQVEDTDIGIVWSLVCELIYYGLYPVIFLLARRQGWRIVIGTAYLLALAVICLRPSAHSYPAYGNLLTWCVGLPCWLLGCLLAESSDAAAPKEIRRPEIWFWRATVWAFSSIALLLRFHTPVGYPWTLTLFGALCFFWLRLEIAYFRVQKPFRLLEWAGTWSYSIYLGHELVIPFFSKVGISIPTSNFISVPLWGLRMLTVLAFCLGFYWLFEFPAHQLARIVGKRIAQSKT